MEYLVFALCLGCEGRTGHEYRNLAKDRKVLIHNPHSRVLLLKFCDRTGYALTVPTLVVEEFHHRDISGWIPTDWGVRIMQEFIVMSGNGLSDTDTPFRLTFHLQGLQRFLNHLRMGANIVLDCMIESTRIGTVVGLRQDRRHTGDDERASQQAITYPSRHTISPVSHDNRFLEVTPSIWLSTDFLRHVNAVAFS